MAFDIEKREASHFLTGVEDGSLTAADAAVAAAKLDPVTVHVAIKFLREKYPPGGAQSQGVIERLVEITGTYDDVVTMARTGEKDPVTKWFNDTYEMREFFNDSEQLIDLLIDKLES